MEILNRKQITQNMSGKQIADVLDCFLLNCIKLLVLNTRFLDSKICSIFIQTINNHRRKVTSKDKDIEVENFYKFVMLEDHEEKIKIIRRMELERNLWENIINEFLDLSKDYVYRYDNWIPMTGKDWMDQELKVIEDKVKANRQTLKPTIINIKKQMHYYHQFKYMIMQKYVKLAWKEAIVLAHNNRRIETDEAFQNIIMAISTAISKYSPNKGALTTFINYWILNTKKNPQFGHEYGHSYDLKSKIKRDLYDEHGNANEEGNVKVNGEVSFSISISDLKLGDDECEDEPREEMESKYDAKSKTDLLKRLLKYGADQYFVTCLMLDIDYPLSDRELQLIKSQSVK
jgi:hypothetical protein